MTEQDQNSQGDPLLHDIGETVELLISDVVYPGRGLARLDKMVVFVAGVLPGELVRAQITARKKTFAEARLLEILEPSAQRCEPECPLAITALDSRPDDQPVCPGCSYQHMRYKQELRLKDAQLTDLLERMGGGPPQGAHLQPVPSPSPYGYRNKMVVHACVSGDSTVIGYFGEDNRTVIPVHGCPLAADAINERFGELLADTDFMQRLEDKANVTLRYTSKDGVVHWSGRKPKGVRWLTEKTPLGDLSVPVTGFAQVNPAVSAQLLRQVRAHIRKKQPTAVVDAYCGCGPFALAAADANVEAVLGIDSDSKAIQSARYNAQGLRLRRAEFIDEPVARVLKKALAPVNPAESLLIVDPPRHGLEKIVLQTICESGPAHLVYISCSPDILSRDVRTLRESGYTIESRQLFDMFPRTSHFETLLLMSRK